MKILADAGEISPIIVKKSKFIATASPISSEREAIEFIKRIKQRHPKATHRPYVYRLVVDRELVNKTSDDGELPNCSSDGIYYVMEKMNIVNTIIIIVRYYGGIKLGKGRLMRSYVKATTEIIKIIGTKEYSTKN